MATRNRVPPFEVFARERRFRVSAPSTYESALSLARQRRRAIEAFLRQPTDGLFARRFTGREDEGEDRVGDKFLEGAAAAAQTARLHWQLRSDTHLLADAVSSALEALVPEPEGSTEVSIRPLDARDRRSPDSYPWRIVIETNEPQVISAARNMTQMPVAVDLVVSRRHFVAFSRCQAGTGGLDGVVGGLLAHPDGRVWSTTCRHVITDGCGSQAYPSGPWRDPSTPDAVLLNPNTGCFAHPPGLSSPVGIATESDAARLQMARAAVRKNHPQCSPRRGYIRYPVSAVTYMQRWIKFPHFSVRPWQWAIGPFRYPAGGFSREGDSGSWVFEEGTRTWIGMVVGGYDDGRDVAVADARSLVDFFSRLVSGKTNPDPSEHLIPYCWP